ncbi:hypothetical protein ACOBQJ_00985 [Pelotomaculum propionicicum]|uniref:hypothetical protein n=1 Tax=Pelotomaculum propionicicum TaxID=258475 RepID=UPI003B769437
MPVLNYHLKHAYNKKHLIVQTGNSMKVTSTKLASAKLPSGITPTGVSASAEIAKLPPSPPQKKM